MSKTVAVIGKIVEIKNIENADRIEQAVVVCGSSGKWVGCVRVGDFSVGDLVEVYLQDAQLPETDRFSFMKKSDYRIHVQRLRGALSECLIMPLTVDGSVGDNIGDLISVTKYEKPLPMNIGGDILGHFPEFIPKTDEPNFQKVPHLLEALADKPWYATVKCDGSSATAYKYRGHFGCCSRNYELKDTKNNAIWEIAHWCNLMDNLDEGIAVQFEVVGPGIQKNPMGLKQVEPRVFSIYDIQQKRYLPMFDHILWGEYCGLPCVPLAGFSSHFDLSEDDLREFSTGCYKNGKQREGVVVRPQSEMLVMGERLSFKVINSLYKD